MFGWQRSFIKTFVMNEFIAAFIITIKTENKNNLLPTNYRPLYFLMCKYTHIKSSKGKTTNNTQENPHKVNSCSFSRNSASQKGMAEHI